jgi:hypothetical protein
MNTTRKRHINISQLNVGSAEQLSPVQHLPVHDCGAETLRNYRYQSAYAVVLLVAAAAGRNDYKAVWCEQEDDILAEIGENLFDSFQVKTQKPELGPWTCTADAFVSAVKVFLGLDKRFPSQMRCFYFVSNTECLESNAKEKEHLCPKRLASAATVCSAWTDLPEPAAKGFRALAKKTGSPEKALFKVLRRLGFVRSPDRESFVAELAQNHLRELEWWRLPQTRLEIVVRSLIELVDSASSLTSQDSARHYPHTDKDPQLKAKRITVEEFILKSREIASPSFRYLPALTTSPLSQVNKDLKRFKLKLCRGGLDHYADSLRNQLLSAEAIFIDLATRGPEGQTQLTQIENVTKAECDAAHLRASQGTKPFGQRMLIEVQDRLSQISKEEPHKIGKQPFEALMGMVGILTESCYIWWSEKFDLENQS